MEGRQFSRNKKARETLIGIDSSGAEYWLVPFSEAKVGHRKFVVRKSNKKVPDMLEGMFTDTSRADQMFNKWIEREKAKKRAPAKKAEAEKADTTAE